MADVIPLPAADVLARSSRALGKIDLWGRRGATMLSFDECEAMALLLAAIGLVATAPGTALPEAYFLPPDPHVEGVV